MDTTRFLRMPTGRTLLFMTIFFIVLVMTERSVFAHGGDGVEMNSSHSSQSISPNPASPKAAGLQAASWALSMPYGAVKIAYAIGGGAVGSLAWAATGGNMELAKSIWIPSMTGDYIIQPQNLTGEKRLYFVGPPE